MEMEWIEMLAMWWGSGHVNVGRWYAWKDHLEWRVNEKIKLEKQVLMEYS